MEKIQEKMKLHNKENDKELANIVQKMCGGTIQAAYRNIAAVKEYNDIKKTININVNVEKKLKPTMLMEISKAVLEKKKEIIEGLADGTLKTVKDVKEFRTGKIIDSKLSKKEEVITSKEHLKEAFNNYSQKKELLKYMEDIGDNLLEWIGKLKDADKPLQYSISNILEDVLIFLRTVND